MPAETFDLVIPDITLPKVNDWEIWQAYPAGAVPLRPDSDAPLYGKTDYVIKGMDAGANGSIVTIDGYQTTAIDPDALELIYDFMINAPERDIKAPRQDCFALLV